MSRGNGEELLIPVVSASLAERMVEKGSEAFLATITCAGAEQEVMLGKILAMKNLRICSRISLDYRPRLMSCS